jgi:hypothetical protein
LDGVLIGKFILKKSYWFSFPKFLQLSEADQSPFSAFAPRLEEVWGGNDSAQSQVPHCH